MSAADFKMIRPLTITDAILTSTTVPETIAATYAGGTTYAAGDRAGLAPVYGDPQLVYESLSAGNVGNALPVPPATTTAYWKYVGTVYMPYASGSSCGIGGIVSSISTDVHLLYESLVAANTGNPLSDTTKWLGSTAATQRATNARAMFDTTYGSQTEAPDSIVTVLTPGALVNSIFLGNLSAASVTVAQSVSGWSQTIPLTSHPVTDWYSWFYEDILMLGDAAITEIPPYAASTLTVTVANAGATAKCGICVIGKSATLGKTQWELMGSYRSYSGTTTNTFGNTTFLARTGVKLLNLDVHIQAGYESEAFRLLTLYTDMPMVFIGSTDYNMAMVYGYLGNWSIPVSNSGKTAPIELIGLT